MTDLFKKLQDLNRKTGKKYTIELQENGGGFLHYKAEIFDFSSPQKLREIMYRLILKV